MKWVFPSNNNGDINGIGNPGIETFQGTPLRSLAREICQNSLDAAKPDSVVEIEFVPFSLETYEIPNIESLRKVFKESFDFWEPQSSKRAKEFFNNAIKVADVGVISFLRISDFNTTGLLGSKVEYNTPWCNLTKSSGTSDKAGTSGGSFGIGKFAPFACSDFRTVFYNTLDTEGVCAFQGISRLASFKRKEDNEITIGVGYYGADKNLPIYEQLNLDPKFSRSDNQTGTDIFVAGFKYHSIDWKCDIISSVLDGFLHAIFKDKLVVRVDDVEISKKNLPVLMEEYKAHISENADKYYAVLSSTDTKWYETDFKNHGKVLLGLIIQPEMHRKVAMIRKTGMKIMDRGNISGVIPFAGVMLIEGDKINDFLRSIENPQHTKWEPERSQKVGHAREFVRELINYIKECLDKLKQEDSSEEIDPSVGEYLPDEVQAEPASKDQEAEAITNTIKAIEKTVVTKRTTPSDMSSKGSDTVTDADDGDIIEEEPESGTGHDHGDNGGGNGGHGDIDGTGTGPYPKEHRKKLTSISPAKVRVVCLNKDGGEYSISFVPSVSATEGFLELFLSAESQNYEATIKQVQSLGQPDLIVSENRVKNLSFEAHKPVRLRVTLDYSDYCSMEVKAYGYKI